MTDRETRLSETKPDPFVGRTFDGYRVDEVIGRGGMGVVYKATQKSLGRPVAIKILPEELAEHPQFLERFRREVDVLSKLSHPNVVTVFERGEVDGRQYLVMEYVAGTSLREIMKAGPLPPHEALVIVRGVLSALEHAHEKGIVHRDIKPENVLVAPGGIVEVADFGLSRLLGPADVTRLTHTHLLLGTFEYMAPEQRERAKEADARSDLYATGVVLYELIAGELPIGRFEPLSRKSAECDSRIDDVVDKSLHKSPDARYQRASEMGDAVSQLLTPPPVAGASPASPAPRQSKKPGTPRHSYRVPTWGWVLILCAVLLPALGVLATFLYMASGMESAKAKVIGERNRIESMVPTVPEEPEWTPVSVGPRTRAATIPAGTGFDPGDVDDDARDWARRVAAADVSVKLVWKPGPRELWLEFEDGTDQFARRRLVWAYNRLLHERYGAPLRFEHELGYNEFEGRLEQFPIPERIGRGASK